VTGRHPPDLVPVLRRDEVALLAGVSTEYYRDEGRRLVTVVKGIEAVERAPRGELL
jgi:hypothetical protein